MRYKFRAIDLFSDDFIYAQAFFIDSDNNQGYLINRIDDHFCVKKETVGEFTGLYDKNNKTGFEGDIILVKDGQMISQSYDFPNDEPKEEFKDIVSQIKFISPSFCYFHPNVNEWIPIDCEFEIIGNIHQNKDLLK